MTLSQVQALAPGQSVTYTDPDPISGNQPVPGVVTSNDGSLLVVGLAWGAASVQFNLDQWPSGIPSLS